MKKTLYILALLLMPINLKSQTYRTVSNDQIRKVVEELPYFESEKCFNLQLEQKLKCADAEMFEFVYSKISYPEKAKINKVEGTVLIKFVVEKNGSLSNFTIIKDPGEGCGPAALQAVKKIEKFMPAQLNGQSVRTYYQLPVRFYLEEYYLNQKIKN